MDLFLRFLHVGVAAAWFGHKILIPGDLSATVAGGLDQLRAQIPRLDRAERLGQVTGAGTLVTGLLLAWHVGFETLEATVYTGFGLVVLAILIGAVIARPASNNLRAAIGEGDLAAASASSRMISRVLAAESLLWATTLVLMLI